MTIHRSEHALRMEKTNAWLRAAAVFVVGTEMLFGMFHASGGAALLALWGVAMAYATVTLLAEPYGRMPLIVWDVATGFFDWGLITLGIVFTGGLHSELYLLYFVSVLSVAMRFGLREVVIAAAGTALGYVGILCATTTPWHAVGEPVVVRMSYLLLFAIGNGLLAREVKRQVRARIAEKTQRLTVQEVTATICHDLQNPLTAVTGLVEILLDSTNSSLSLDQRALLHRINANTQQMSELVSNLLDAELIERGHSVLRPSPLDLNPLVRRAVEAQAHHAEIKHIGLVLDLHPRLPIVALDGRMIERLVANLLSNALKFTPEGGAIRVSTRQHGGRIAIEVWDSGPEVPTALQTRLFEKFVRHSDSPGVGLGLYICKSVVDMHGGRIRVRHPADGGVTFVAELPSVSSASALGTGTAAVRVRESSWQTPTSLGVLARS